ncbi:glyoxalase [Bacillus thuringiensis]|uniref:glyoxalase n=1 Tax=Bacillus thuringiensis TaxID=1428 RepID=UPI000BF9982D|nr:glyoxalase [Bacillus thuringiensis]PFU58174.1 glyoxalase [Bacillus thuringiensis]
MKKVIEEYINHLKQSAVENKKESEKAYENGDLGLSGYLRGQWIANEGIATALETILTQHREENVSSNLLN